MAIKVKFDLKKRRLSRQAEETKDEFLIALEKTGARPETLDVVSKIKAASPKELISTVGDIVKTIDKVRASTPSAKLQGIQEKVVEKAAVQQAKSQIKNKQENIKALDEYSSTANLSLTGLRNIEAAARALPDFSSITGFFGAKKRGILAQTEARASAAINKFSRNKNVQRYITTVSQELAPLARGVAGEKGPLTEGDIKRVEEGLGSNLETPLSDKLFAISQLVGKMEDQIMFLANKAGLSGFEVEDKYGPLLDKLRDIKQRFESEPDLSQQGVALDKGAAAAAASFVDRLRGNKNAK